MKKLAILFIFFGILFGENLRIEDFKSDLYSKNSSNLKKLNLSLEVVGRDVSEQKLQIYDGLNIIIGSFYIEDLMTSAGKESFKKTFLQYISKKHGVDIDEVFIIKLNIDSNLDIDKIVEAIKEQGCK